jgi:hypothetical protein
MSPHIVLEARSYKSSVTFSRPHVAFLAPTVPAQWPFAFHNAGTFTHVLLN